MEAIGGRYALETELGRGAAGVVYRARDTQAGGRLVAVKLLTAASRTAQRRFQIEARALQRLDHDHLVRVLDSGEVGGRPYLVMELVDGSSLQARLTAGGPLPPREAATVARDLARALQHAHERGVIHRDVKPANVLMDRAGRARLGDFGLARELDGAASRVTMEGAILGTPGYLPPEQVRGELERIGPPADVYALGATLYALLTGDPPFASESLGALLDDTLRQRARAPSRVAPDVDAGLDAIVLRCLEKDPQRRYASGGELAADLDRWLGGRRPSSLPGLPALPRPRWRSLRRPLLVALLLACLGAWGWDQHARGALRGLSRLEDEAEGWLLAREWARAEAAATRALTLDAASRRALGARILARQFRADLEGAVADAERLVALAPDDPAALAAAVGALRDPERQRQLVAHGLALDAGHAGLLLLRAHHRQLDQDRDGAVADLRLAVERDPRHVEAHAALYRLLRETDPPRALQAIRRACQLEPGRGDLQEELGLVLRALGDRAGAVEAYRRGGYLGHWRAMWRLAEAALEGPTPSLAQAEVALSDWLARGEQPILRTYRARLRLARGDLPGAEADLDLVTVLLPEDADVAMWRGLVRFNQRDFAGAEEDFDRSWRLGSDPVQLTNRGVARLELGRLEEAERDLRLASELAPKSANAQAQLGLVLERLGRGQEALERYQRAIDNDPARISAYEGAARVLAAQGQTEAARELLGRAEAQLRPGDPRAAALADKLDELGR